MPSHASSILFFAYGSFLEQSRMRRLDARCEEMGVARVDDHRIEFTTQGFANLRREEGARVWGILWVVPASCMAEMDEWAKERGFSRGVTFVVSPAGPRVPATSYVDGQSGSGQPDPEELAKIMAAARAAKLDPTYQAELQRWRK